MPCAEKLKINMMKLSTSEQIANITQTLDFISNIIPAINTNINKGEVQKLADIVCDAYLSIKTDIERCRPFLEEDIQNTKDSLEAAHSTHEKLQKCGPNEDVRIMGQLVKNIEGRLANLDKAGTLMKKSRLRGCICDTGTVERPSMSRHLRGKN